MAVSVPIFSPARQIGRQNRLCDSLWGRLSEISAVDAGGQMTLAVSLLQEAQQQGHMAAWVQPLGGDLFPPDIAACGVDLAALLVVHVDTPQQAAARLRAAEILLTGGGFAFVVLDMGRAAPSGDAWQGRLLRLVRQHHSAVVLLTRSTQQAASLGPLISLRLAPVACGSRPRDRFDVGIAVLKSKVGAVQAPLRLARRGPPGLL